MVDPSPGTGPAVASPPVAPPTPVAVPSEAPAIAATPASPDADPARLEALHAAYEHADPKGEDAYEIQQTRAWHKQDYKRLMLAATRGDSKALGKLLALVLDGAGAEIHAANLEQLMLGYGDERFAAALGGQARNVVAEVHGMLDWSQQMIETSAAEHYRQSHPRTFAVVGTR